MPRKKEETIYTCAYLKKLKKDIDKGWRYFWMKRGYTKSIKKCTDIIKENKIK